MIVNKVDKKVKMSRDGVIRYQILTFCFINDLMISASDLKCLTELAKLGSHELTDFCKLMTSMDIFKSPQSARNAITKYHKKKLVEKKGKNRKSVSLHNDMNVQTKGTILLDYKFLGIEAEGS